MVGLRIELEHAKRSGRQVLPISNTLSGLSAGSQYSTASPVAAAKQSGSTGATSNWLPLEMPESASPYKSFNPPLQGLAFRPPSPAVSISSPSRTLGPSLLSAAGPSPDGRNSSAFVEEHSQRLLALEVHSLFSV